VVPYHFIAAITGHPNCSLLSIAEEDKLPVAQEQLVFSQ
jgi:hypothetical protein